MNCKLELCWLRKKCCNKDENLATHLELKCRSIVREAQMSVCDLWWALSVLSSPLPQLLTLACHFDSGGCPLPKCLWTNAFVCLCSEQQRLCGCSDMKKRKKVLFLPPSSCVSAASPASVPSAMAQRQPWQAIHFPDEPSPAGGQVTSPKVIYAIVDLSFPP